MRLLSLPANEYRRERWRNERGWTREIYRHPEGSGDWEWRVSIAEVDQDAPFSTFPGCDRELVLLPASAVLEEEAARLLRLPCEQGLAARPGDWPWWNSRWLPAPG